MKFSDVTIMVLHKHITGMGELGNTRIRAGKTRTRFMVPIVALGIAEEVTMSIDASQLPYMVTVGTPGHATVTVDHICKLLFLVCCVIY